MFDWISGHHTHDFDAAALLGVYQFSVLIGDLVDGNGGIWSKTGEGGPDMWPALRKVFQEILDSHPPVLIAAVTGNHDYKGNEFGHGTWSSENIRRAGDWLEWLYRAQRPGIEHIPRTTPPFSSFKRWTAGIVPFLAVFLPHALPHDETLLVDQFLGNNAQYLTIVCSHICDDTLPYTVAKHKQVFTSWWGHIPAQVSATGKFTPIPVRVHQRPQFGSKCFIYRADWQETHKDCAASSNFPQHPLFCVFAFEVSDDNSALTMTQHNVQAFNASNSTYRAEAWLPAQTLIAQGSSVTVNDKQTLRISDYITLP